MGQVLRQILTNVPPAPHTFLLIPAPLSNGIKESFRIVLCILPMPVPFFGKHINLLGILENKHRLRQSKSLPEDTASFDHHWIGTDVITLDFKHQNYHRNQTTAGEIQFSYFILCPRKAQLISKRPVGSILNSSKKINEKKIPIVL